MWQAHCEEGKPGAATLLLINVSPTVTFEASLPAAVIAADGGAEVFEFAAGDGVRDCLCLVCSTAFVAKILPLPRVSTAFVTKTLPLPSCAPLVCSTAFEG